MNEKKKTIGIRVPDNKIAQALLEALGEPLLSTTLILPESDMAEFDPEEIFDKLGKQLDLVVNGGYLGEQPTTVVDFSDDEPVLRRRGAGTRLRLSDTADPVPVTTTPMAGERVANPAGEAIPPQAVPSPIARVLGQPYHELPQDLFIPPDALEVFLDTFEGPLDLLLYLIRRQQLDILNLPILQITAQYMEYVELMQGLNLELAAEYLLMAAWLAEIKSRLLLPRRRSWKMKRRGKTPRYPHSPAAGVRALQGGGGAGQRAAAAGAGDLHRHRPAAGFWRSQTIDARCFAG